MAVNPTPDPRGARARRRRVNGIPMKRLRLGSPSTEGGAYPEALLRYPSAAMFLLMREALRIGQQCAAKARTPAEQMRFPHFAVLACLEEFGAESQREISDRLSFDPSDLVGLVDWLEAAGFARRQRDDRDRRRHAVVLTPAGRRALRVRARSADRLNAELFGALDDTEREQLRRLLLRAVRGRH